LTYQQAAIIIGKHFPEVNDKLINILELKGLADKNPRNRELIEASINQKIDNIKIIPFTYAIDFKKTKKYLKLLYIPVLIFIIMLVSFPSIITDSSARIIYHNKIFKEEAPFKINILNNNLSVIQNHDITIKINVSGKILPNELFIISKLGQYRAEKKKNNYFEYTFTSVNRNIDFIITDNKYSSDQYTINVVYLPAIMNFTINLNYPKYTGKADEQLSNVGDLIVPYGTKITWLFYTKETDKIIFQTNEKVNTLNPIKNNFFSNSIIATNNISYSIKPIRQNILFADSMSFSITTIIDEYPKIDVIKNSDSINLNLIYFEGNISDDYGFSQLSFNYRINPEKNPNEKFSSIPIQISKNLTKEKFYYVLDTKSLTNNPDDDIEYYFEVKDNDAINNFKSTKTNKFNLKPPSPKEISQLTNNTDNSIKNTLAENIKKTISIRKDINEINKKLLEKNNLNWEEKNKLENIIDKYKSIKENLTRLRQENEKSIALKKQNSNINQSLLEKQKLLDELFEKLLNDDLKNLFKQLDELLQNIDKNEIKSKIDELKLSEKDIEKELDRTLNLFKQLEVENKLNEIINMSQKLSEKQLKLSEKTETTSPKDNKTIEDIKQQQQQINDEYKNLKDKIDELKELNKNLEEPRNLPNTDDDNKQISDEINKVNDNLNQKNTKNAAKSQKNISQKLDELSNKLSSFVESSEQQEEEEGIEKLSKIFYDLLKLSFSQENLLNELKQINPSSPQYSKILQQQKNIKDQIKTIEDTLFKLSKKHIEIESVVNNEIKSINNNINKSIDAITNYNIPKANMNQQYVITSINNLALMVGESITKIKQNSNSSDKDADSQKSCKNPKKGGKGQKSKPNLQSISKMQQELNKQIKELQEKLKKGENPKKLRSNELSKDIVKMAAQQEAIRKYLNEIQEEIKKQNQIGNNDIKKAIEEMEKLEKDLINLNINDNIINRQQNIMTRLLEAEKAYNEQDIDEKRESKTSNIENLSNPTLKFQYKRKENDVFDILKNENVKLNYFYKSILSNYQNNLESLNNK